MIFIERLFKSAFFGTANKLTLCNDKTKPITRLPLQCLECKTKVRTPVWSMIDRESAGFRSEKPLCSGIVWFLVGQEFTVLNLHLIYWTRSLTKCKRADDHHLFPISGCFSTKCFTLLFFTLPQLILHWTAPHWEFDNECIQFAITNLAHMALRFIENVQRTFTATGWHRGT